jgi:AcrR family transcriptional regulator
MPDKILSGRARPTTTAGQTGPITRRARQARTAAHTREGMLHAAAQALARHGLEATTMQEIAREAGYTVPSLYAYFNGKQEIIEALLQQMGEQLAMTFTDPMPVGLTFPQKLELLLQRQLEFGQEWREAFKVIFAAKIKKNLGGMSRQPSFAGPYVESLNRWLKEASRPEDLRDYEVDELADMLQGILHATFDRWLLTRQPRRLADRASSITHLLLYGLLSERSAARR